jgi:hypothetical protein
MKAMKPLYLITISLILTGCLPKENQEDLKKELMEADLAFSDMSKAEGMNKAFKTFSSDEAVLLREGSMPVVGRTEIDGLLDKTDDSPFVLTWEPLYARASRSGDLGYTYGLFAMAVESMDTTLRGTYVSIWAKENGEWKWVLDTGNQGLGDQ